MTDPTHGQDGQARLSASESHDTTPVDRRPRTSEDGLGGVGDGRAEASAPVVDEPRQGDTLRAAQIQAVRDVMGVGRQPDDFTERAVADTAAEVVDAVLNAGGLCGHTTRAVYSAGHPLVCTLPAGHTGRWHGDDNGTRWARNEPTPDALDQAEAHGYAKAVANLRGVVQRTGRPFARWAADYLEAVGAGADETVREVVHRCPPPGAGTTPCCGRTPFELGETSKLTADDALVTCSRPLSATQSAQDGLGAERVRDEAPTEPTRIVDGQRWCSRCGQPATGVPREADAETQP